MRASIATTGVATKAASVVFQSKERMLQPGLSHLFKAVVVARSATHPIKILRNDRMVGFWQLKPIHLDVSVVARGRSHSQTDLGSATSKLLQVGQISHDDIGPRHSIRGIWSAAASRGQYRGLGRAVDYRRDFDRIHGRGDRNSPNDRTSIRRSPKLGRKLC